MYSIAKIKIRSNSSVIELHDISTCFPLVYYFHKGCECVDSVQSSFIYECMYIGELIISHTLNKGECTNKPGIRIRIRNSN